MKRIISIVSCLCFLSISPMLLGQNYSSTSGWGGEKVKGEGGSVEETRSITDFKGVANGIAADVIITQSKQFKVRIEGQKNIIAYVETIVEAGVLKIRTKKGYSLTYSVPLKIYVDAPLFETISSSGSGDMSTTNTLTGANLSIASSGSGDIKLKETDCPNINIRSSGSGDIKVAGKTQNLTLASSGSGEINAQALQAKDVECKSSGSGDVACAASGVLNVSASGSGDVIYEGTPASVKTRKTGSGSIRSR